MIVAPEGVDGVVHGEVLENLVFLSEFLEDVVARWVVTR
jgi:hypothetical protein